jgi:hypothetical protein
MSLLLRNLLFASAVSLASCSGGGVVVRGEGLDVSALPANIQPEYAVFSQRCSKCHSLTRPLNSGIADDHYWQLYVERMRRQPASGITLEDVPVILRFLHYYSVEITRAREQAKTSRAASTRGEL